MRIRIISECEIKDGGTWKKIHIDDALQKRGALLRCPVCHGRMEAHKENKLGGRQHFGHMVGHTGCPTTPRKFSGVVSIHPDALD